MENYKKITREMNRMQELINNPLQNGTNLMQEQLISNPLQEEIFRMQKISRYDEIATNSLLREMNLIREQFFYEKMARMEEINQRHEFINYPLKEKIQFTGSLQEEANWMERIRHEIMNNSLYEANRIIENSLHTEVARMREFMRNPLQDEINRIQEIVKSPLWDEINKIRDTENNIFSDISSFVQDVKNIDITLNENLTVSCAGQVFEISRVQDLVEQTLYQIGFDEKIYEQNELLITEIRTLITEVRNIKDSRLRTFVKVFLMPLLSAFILIFFTPQFHNISSIYFPINKKEVVKRVETRVLQLTDDDGLDKNILNDYRIITARALNVRAKNKRNSRIIGKFYIGNVVKVIKKKKNWTLIEWKNNDDEILIQGWVFSRYLKRIKLHQ